MGSFSQAGCSRQASPRAQARVRQAEPGYLSRKRYEQPEVAPQFGHLWQAPELTIKVPHSWQGGASVSGTQTVISIGDNLAVPIGIVIEGVGSLVVSDAGSMTGGSDLVIRVDIASGTQTIISTGGSMDVCAGMAMNGDGNFYR